MSSQIPVRPHNICISRTSVYRDIESDKRELHPGLASRFWCLVTPSTLIFAVLKDFCLSSSQQSIRVQTILCVSRKMIVDDWKYIAVLRCGTCRVTRYLSSDRLWRNRQLMTESRKVVKRTTVCPFHTPDRSWSWYRWSRDCRREAGFFPLAPSTLKISQSQ